jgi:hypothetical protein
MSGGITEDLQIAQRKIMDLEIALARAESKNSGYERTIKTLAQIKSKQSSALHKMAKICHRDADEANAILASVHLSIIESQASEAGESNER